MARLGRSWRLRPFGQPPSEPSQWRLSPSRPSGGWFSRRCIWTGGIAWRDIARPRPVPPKRCALCLRADTVIGKSPGAFGDGPTTASKDDTNGPLTPLPLLRPASAGLYLKPNANWDFWPHAPVCSLVHRQRVRNSSESDIAANAFQVIP
jgi:hypothetical protein